jgi:hypothetical protein
MSLIVLSLGDDQLNTEIHSIHSLPFRLADSKAVEKYALLLLGLFGSTSMIPSVFLPSRSSNLPHNDIRSRTQAIQTAGNISSVSLPRHDSSCSSCLKISIGAASIDAILSEDERSSFIEFDGEMTGTSKGVDNRDCQPL